MDAPMGYYINITDSHFAINTVDIPRFFELVSDLMSDENIKEHGSGGRFNEKGEKIESWYAFVDNERVRKAINMKEISDVFWEWSYELDFLHENDGVSHYRLDLTGGERKIGDDERFLTAISPIVRDGCYISVRGEDGEEWRWVFDNGRFGVMNVTHKEVFYSEPSYFN